MTATHVSPTPKRPPNPPLDDPEKMRRWARIEYICSVTDERSETPRMTPEQLCDYRDRKQTKADVYLGLAGVPIGHVATGQFRTPHPTQVALRQALS